MVRVCVVQPPYSTKNECNSTRVKENGSDSLFFVFIKGASLLCRTLAGVRSS